MHRICFRLSLVATLALVSCEQSPTEVLRGTEAMYAKGGNGKPGGDGNKAPDPVLAFGDGIGGLWVANEDGSNRTLVFDEGVWVRKSSWAPFGTGTEEDPYRLIFWTDVLETSWTADIDTAGGRVNVTTQRFSPSGPKVEWGPEDGTEMAYVQVTFNPNTRQHDSELFIVSEVLGPSPVSTSVYIPPQGNSIGSMAWSPGGDALAFLEGGDSGTAVRVLNRTEGEVTTLIDFGELAIDSGQGLDWSRFSETDYTRLVFTVFRPQKKHGGALTLHVMQLTGGAGNYMSIGEPLLFAGFTQPTWSPGGSRLAARGERGHIKIIDLTTGEESSLAKASIRPDWRR